jgi:hypothetical protein
VSGTHDIRLRKDEDILPSRSLRRSCRRRQATTGAIHRHLHLHYVLTLVQLTSSRWTASGNRSSQSHRDGHRSRWLRSPGHDSRQGGRHGRLGGRRYEGPRDRAILLLGFAGAFRRSELVALDVTDLEFCEGGMRVHIGRSKTDREGAGDTIAIARGSVACPVKAVRA